VVFTLCHDNARDSGCPTEHRLAAERIWRAEDGLELKALRESCGWDVWALSRACALSAGQIRQLEDGGESLFYTAAIKAHAGRHALARLEAHVCSIRRAAASHLPQRPDAPSSES